MATPEDFARARAAWNGEDPGAVVPMAAPVMDAVPMQGAMPAPVEPGAIPVQQVAPMGEAVIDPWQGELQQAAALPELEAQPVPAPAIANAPQVVSQDAPEPVATPGTDVAGMAPRQRAAALSDDIDQAGVDAQDAAIGNMGAREQLAAKRAESAQQRATMLEDTIKEQEGRAEKFSAERKALLGEFSAINDEIANTSIGDKRSEGQKVMGVIATAFGGIADALASAGPTASSQVRTNTANQISQGIRAQVENSMALQREALDGKRKEAAGKLTELGRAREAYGDDMTAMKAVTSIKLDQVAASMTEIASQVEDADRKAVLETSIANIQRQSAKTKADLFTQAESAHRAAQIHARKMKGGGKKGPSFAQILAMKKFEREGKQYDEQTALKREELGIAKEQLASDRAVDPQYIAREKGGRLTADVVVADPSLAAQSYKEAPKLQKSIDARKKVLSMIAEVEQIRKDNPVTRGGLPGPLKWVMSTDAESKLKSLQVGMNMEMKNVLELGALSKDDNIILQTQSGDLASKGWLDSDADIKLGTLKKELINGSNAAMSARGYEKPFTPPPIKPDEVTDDNRSDFELGLLVPEA